MIPLSLMLVLAALLAAMIAKRHRLTWLYAVTAVCGLAAAYVLVSLIDNVSHGAAAGKYVYYVNGVRVSEGAAFLTENLALFAILGLFLVLIPLRLGIFLGRKLESADRSGRRPAWALIIWLLCALAGGWVLWTSITGLSRPTRPPIPGMRRQTAQTVGIIVCAVSALVTLTGLAGAVRFLAAGNKKG